MSDTIKEVLILRSRIRRQHRNVKALAVSLLAVTILLALATGAATENYLRAEALQASFSEYRALVDSAVISGDQFPAANGWEYICTPIDTE